MFLIMEKNHVLRLKNLNIRGEYFFNFVFFLQVPFCHIQRPPPTIYATLTTTHCF